MIDFKNYNKKIKTNIQFQKQLMSRRTQGEKTELTIYSTKEIWRDYSKKYVKITPFLIGGGAPCVIICPGGAYKFTSKIKEGINFAIELNRIGYNAVVLNYSTGRYAKFPAPMNDLAQCIIYIKEHADAMNIDAANIHLLGASAGGHLCAYFGANYKLFEKPIDNFTHSLQPASISLAYPVISMCEDFHRISRLKLLGANPSEQEIYDKSMEFNVDKNYPPTFLFHCKDDLSVPVSNSIRFEQALDDANVFHEMKLYETGGHGVGLGAGTDAFGWINYAAAFMDRFD